MAENKNEENLVARINELEKDMKSLQLANDGLKKRIAQKEGELRGIYRTFDFVKNLISSNRSR